MTFKEFRDIALHAARGTAPANFSVENVNEAFKDGLQELAGSYNQFMKNRYDIFDILIEATDEILPRKVISTLGMFCEVQQVGQGQKAMFKQHVTHSRMRARKFLTQVGLSGVYETFRLDKETFELAAHAIGGGVTIDYERMLDGAETLAEVMDIIAEGLTDSVFYEVHRALHASLNDAKRPAANKVISTSFNAQAMEKLINVVRAYGTDAVIFAPPEFITAMGPDAIVPAMISTSGGGAQGIYHPGDIDAIHNTGFIKIFRGVPIVQIPQSFIDENNVKTWIDPQMAYIFPNGADKVVKVVLEGQTQMKEHVNKDNSIEIYTWKKMGAAIFHHNNWCIYQNTGITNTFEDPWGWN